MNCGGRRGLYMALGSVVTLAVLMAAVIEGPKLMRGGAANAQDVPAATPSVPIPAADSPPAMVPAATPVQLPRPVQQSVPAQYAFRPAQPPVQLAQAAPAVEAASAPAPASGGTPVTAATASPELKELRDRINRVAIRAAAAQAAVRSIEGGVEWQGLGLRGDIKAASIRLDYILQEARASLLNGDVEGARNNLQYAEGTLQKIDKFLGQ